MKRHAVTILGLILLVAIACGALGSSELLQEGEFVFFWEQDKAYLIANEAPLNAILAEISATTGVPIAMDPGNQTLITTDLREKNLESLINSICPSSVITFEKGELAGEYRIASIQTTSTVDAETKKAEARQRTIAENRLDSRLRSRSRRPVQYVGIGAHISPAKDRKGLWLKPINEESPAYKGGIRMGDMALDIDGKPIEEFRHLGYAIKAIRGKPNTSVKFRIREPDGSETYKTVVRKLFKYDPRKDEKK